MHTNHRSKIIPIVIIAVVYLGSFALPAWHWSGSGGRCYGIEAFFWGLCSVMFAVFSWIGIPIALFTGLEIQTKDWTDALFYTLASLSWSANLVLWYGTIALARQQWRKAIISGCIAIVLAGSFWVLFQWRRALHVNIDALSIGYYVWALCPAVLNLIAAMARARAVSAEEYPTIRL